MPWPVRGSNTTTSSIVTKSLTTPPSLLFPSRTTKAPFPSDGDHLGSGSGGPGVCGLGLCPGRGSPQEGWESNCPTSRGARGHSPSIPRGGGSGCSNRKRPLHCLQFPWLLRGSGPMAMEFHGMNPPPKGMTARPCSGTPPPVPGSSPPPWLPVVVRRRSGPGPLAAWCAGAPVAAN